METVYENGQVIVRVNPSGEVFVQHKETSAEIRVGTYRFGLHVTAFGFDWEPAVVNGFPAMSVSIRK